MLLQRRVRSEQRKIKTHVANIRLDHIRLELVVAITDFHNERSRSC